MNKAAHPFRLALVALILAVVPALAQDAAPGPAASSAWRVVLTPYLWLPGINAEVTSRTGRSVPQGGVSASASEVLPQLHGVPFVGAMEIGYGRFSLLADLITIGLRSDAKPRPGYLFGSATLDTRTTLGTVIGFWRMGESADQFFDIGAGIRVTALSTDLRVNGNRLPGFSAGSNSSHVDGIAAFRYGMRFAPAWGLTIAADIGGGGSRLSWEALGSFDWHVSQGTTLRLGWRHIGFDQETRRGGTANLELGGPFLAASFRF
jgi:hypothetical protein